jgi:thiamine kinase-like enzyme
MQNRQQHQHELRTFLRETLSVHTPLFSLPQGSGMETYIVEGNGHRYFIKVGASIERYSAMADLGLTPPIVIAGHMEYGTTILIQLWLAGQTPSKRDFQERLEGVAAVVHKMHHHPRLSGLLPDPPSSHYKDAGLRMFVELRQKWERYKAQVPSISGFVDHHLDDIPRQTELFSGEGLVASHNDICNANWLFTPEGQIYILDFESMKMDDPAADMGALLWWYYSPEMRRHFLDAAGYPTTEEFIFRMRVRMAMHCLLITLPRQGGFDTFYPEHFSEALIDFRAVLAGEENPQGYD